MCAHLSAREFDRLLIGDDIDAGEAAWLARVGDTQPGFCQRGHENVRLGHYCGVVKTGTRVLEVLPKTDGGTEDARTALVSMLRRSRHLPVVVQHDATAGIRQAHLLEIFIGVFLSEVTTIVRGGLRHQYLIRDDDLRVVRGRIDIQQQCVRLYDRRDVIACQFDDFTVDNVWNRLVKAALRLVRGGIETDTNKRRWIELMGALEDVTDVPATTSDFARLRYDRQGTRYRSAIWWASVIIGSMAPIVRAGDSAAPGLLFDMNKLFEATIESVARELAAPLGVAVHTQHSDKYLAVNSATGGECFGIRPDIVLMRNGSVRAIIDAKWKRPETGVDGSVIPRIEDMYQMLAYAASYACSELFLVYPLFEPASPFVETSYTFRTKGGQPAVVTILMSDMRREPFQFCFGRRRLLGALQAD